MPRQIGRLRMNGATSAEVKLSEGRPEGADKVADFPSAAYAWFMVGVLVFAQVVSYIDRQVVAIVVGPMKDYLHVSDSQIGWLYGIFAIFYAVAGIPLAWLADRSSRTRLIAVGVFLWSVVTMLCGLSRSFLQVLLARIGVGVGEAVLAPSANSLIGDLMPRSKVCFAVSVFMAGSVAGSGIAFIVGGFVLSLVQSAGPVNVPILGTVHPWQQVFLYCGASGLLLVPIFLLLGEPKRHNVSGAGKKGASFEDVLAFYRRNGATLVLHHAGFLFLSLMGFGFIFWTVSFFTRVHGMQASTVAQTFGWIYFIVGPMASLWPPILAARFDRAGHKDANITAAMIGGGLAVPLILLTQLMPSALWAFLLYVPAMLCVPSPFGLAYGSLSVIAPPSMRAVVTSVFMFVVNLGMLLGPPIAGLFNERLFPQADGVRYSVTTLTLICGLAGLVLLAFCRRHYGRSLLAADTLESGR